MNVDYAVLAAERRERHSTWFEQNMRVIMNARDVLPVLSNGGECVMFREHGKPRVDFYPSTGRWRCIETGRTMRGGAVSFLGWYRRQVRKS